MEKLFMYFVIFDTLILILIMKQKVILYFLFILFILYLSFEFFLTPIFSDIFILFFINEGKLPSLTKQHLFKK